MGCTIIFIQSLLFFGCVIIRGRVVLVFRVRTTWGSRLWRGDGDHSICHRSSCSEWATRTTAHDHDEVVQIFISNNHATDRYLPAYGSGSSSCYHDNEHIMHEDSDFSEKIKMFEGGQLILHVRVTLSLTDRRIAYTLTRTRTRKLEWRDSEIFGNTRSLASITVRGQGSWP